MNLWNLLARSYRNTRAMGAALVLLLAILSMLSLRCNPMVGREQILGLVLVVEAEGLHPFGEGEPQARVLVATPDSAEVRMFLPPPVPRAGDFIPLTAERYKKGNIEYYLDLNKWRTDGPS
jgi:hypothetical protein